MKQDAELSVYKVILEYSNIWKVNLRLENFKHHFTSKGIQLLQYLKFWKVSNIESSMWSRLGLLGELFNNVKLIQCKLQHVWMCKMCCFKYTQSNLCPKTDQFVLCTKQPKSQTISWDLTTSQTASQQPAHLLVFNISS